MQDQRPRLRSRQTGFDHRTKLERLATILLPNLVAAHDTKQAAMEFQVRCSAVKLLRRLADGSNYLPTPNKVAVLGSDLIDPYFRLDLPRLLILALSSA